MTAVTPSVYWRDDAVTVWHADALTLPVDDESVDLIVTSPPYFGLRSYTDGGEHYDGQLGDEPTPAEFVDALIAATREMMRVLKPSGSLWVNLGDKYVADNRGSGSDPKRGAAKHAPRGPAGYVTGGMRQKSLMLIPQRYAIRCVDELGLILRAEVVWSKPNGLPESVTDRVRRSHETWFHFTKSPRYFASVDTIREPHAREWGGGPNGGHTYGTMKPAGAKDSNLPTSLPNPLGKLPGSVWTIPTQPLKVPDSLGVDHFAAFPMEWPRRIVQAFSPAGVCSACGEGRRPITHGQKVPHYAGGTKGARNGRRREGTPNDDDALPRTNTVVTITGEQCACPDTTAPTRPAVVLDPFGGTGTTALVARALGRHAIHVDLSRDYCRLAQWRLTDPKQAEKAAAAPKPKKPPRCPTCADRKANPPAPVERIVERVVYVDRDPHDLLSLLLDQQTDERTA